MSSIIGRRQENSASALDFLAGGGEMGARMRARDWSKTSLGAVETWPQSLRSPLSMMLPSRAQIILFWGPEFVVFYNDAYRPVFGAKHPQALGLPGREAWSEIWDSMLHGLLSGVVRTGEAFRAEDLLFLLERHGFLEETYFDVSYDPVRDESGRVGGVFCIVTETTGRVVGERRLALLKDLAACNATARAPREACVLAMETLAARPEDVPFALAYLGGELQACTPGAQAALVTAGPGEVKELLIAGSGGATPGRLAVGINPKRPFDEQYESFLDLVAGQLATAVANARAYEAERRRAEALAEIDRAKTAFFSNVSHEFRTPLTLMLGPVEELLSRETGPDRELLAIVQRNGQRLLKLVNTLLDFSRIEAGRVEACYECTNLGALTTDLASSFRAACERAGLCLEIHCPNPDVQGWVDREMWEKIVLNLLSNAFKFTLEGGITVRLADAAESLNLTVADTGIGVPQDSLDRVFERFHRVEGARGRSHEGSGIGLALVHELVKLHGGTISVQSTVGEGTAFTVSIPKGRAHLPAGQVKELQDTSPSAAFRAGAYVAEVLGWLPVPEAGHAAASLHGRQSILLADDNADLRDYVGKILAAHYDVRAVPDGQAAIEAARSLRPDLIISDVMMPNLDGFGLIRELRSDPDLRMVPVILLSARAGEEERVEGIGSGADDYLVKPFSARELLARVGALLKSAGVHRKVNEALEQSVLAREALREADRRKDDFLATLSHELRNPLAPLRSSLEALKLAGADGLRTGPALEIMDRQLNHLVRLVDDLLEVSRITRGTVELRREPVALDAILRNAVETSEALIRAGNHTLNVSIPRDHVVVDADPVRLSQVFGNLLNNAARYSDSGGTITVEARIEPSEVVVTVSDTGEGIEPEQLPQLFQMFVRGNRSSRRHQNGLGIGLALVRTLVEMHGGRVEAASDGPGKGSRFTVRLPLNHPRDAAPAAIESRNSALAPLRILVVDDNPDAAESLGMLLMDAGAEVRVAHDGPAALAAFKECAPRVVLLDIGMPGMDGYEVARRLRALPQEPRVAIVALTGWSQDEDRRRIREAGFDHHLVKPVEFDVLQALIASIQAGGV